MRTPRSRTPGENLFDFLMAPSSQRLEPPQNPGRFSWSRARASTPRTSVGRRPLSLPKPNPPRPERKALTEPSSSPDAIERCTSQVRPAAGQLDNTASTAQPTSATIGVPLSGHASGPAQTIQARQAVCRKAVCPAERAAPKRSPATGHTTQGLIKNHRSQRLTQTEVPVATLGVVAAILNRSLKRLLALSPSAANLLLPIFTVICLLSRVAAQTKDLKIVARCAKAGILRLRFDVVHGGVRPPVQVLAAGHTAPAVSGFDLASGSEVERGLVMFENITPRPALPGCQLLASCCGKLDCPSAITL